MNYSCEEEYNDAMNAQAMAEMEAEALAAEAEAVEIAARELDEERIRMTEKKISSIPFHWKVGHIIEMADKNHEPCDVEITRSDETGCYGVEKVYPQADND